MKLSFAGVLLVAGSLLSASGQSKTPAVPTITATGVVTGHVYCSDTNQPARFAKVSLEPVHSEPTPLNKSSKATPTNTYTSNGVTSVDTDLLGNFTMTQVKPGSYYVIVTKGGYISPRNMFTQKEIDAPTAEMRSMIERILPRVDIDNGQTAHAEVRLERGASISGTVSFDDGTPAGELSVTLMHKDEKGKWIELKGSTFQNYGWTQTNDLGQFRFGSLLPDEYLLKAQMSLGSSKVNSMKSGDTEVIFSMMSFHSSLSFYGQGTARQSEAKPIKLPAGNDLTGQDMVLPISKLFHVTGRVQIEGTGHQVNAADLKLVDKESGQELTTSDIDREDGLFHFDFVPVGTYTLKVVNARDAAWEPDQPAPGSPAAAMPPKDKERVLKTYGNADLPLNVQGDMLGMTATVPNDATKQP